MSGVRVPAFASLLTQFEELKRAALQQSAAQRAQLDQQREARARAKSEAERAAREREQAREEWLAKERERRKERESKEEKQREEAAKARARAVTAARADQASKDRALGRKPTRSPAFEKAKARVAQQSAQRARRTGASLALTREEKRMQRMAKDMGIKFQASRPVSLGPQPSSLHIKRSAPAAGSINSPKRPRTAREQFIEAERQRKTARMAPVEADSDEDDYEPSGDEEDVDDGPSHSSIRDQIWQLLGRNRQPVSYTHLTLPTTPYV